MSKLEKVIAIIFQLNIAVRNRIIFLLTWYFDFLYYITTCVVL